MCHTPATRVHTRSGYLPTLDGWRAIAIGLVFCSHTASWPHRLDILRFPLNSYGHLGVDLFFASSGLLICHRLLEEEAVCGRISLKGFYLRRCFRIFPPAFLYLGLIGLLGLLRVLPNDWAGWWAAVFFVRNYAALFIGADPQNVYTAHFWSLAVEEHFYLILPALLIIFSRTRKIVLLALTVLALAWIVAYTRLVPLSQRSWFWYSRTDIHVVSLLFPAWLSLVLTAEKTRRTLARLLHPALLPIVIVLMVGLKYTDRHFHPELTIAQRIARYDPAPPINSATRVAPINQTDRPVVRWPMALGNPATTLTFVLPLLFPFVILSTLLNPRSLLSRFLELAPMRYVGRLSYSLYLWQELFWERESKGWPIAALQHHPAYVGLLLTVAAAMTSFYFIERPLIRVGHRLAPPATPGQRDLQLPPSSDLGSAQSNSVRTAPPVNTSVLG